MFAKRLGKIEQAMEAALTAAFFISPSQEKMNDALRKIVLQMLQQ